MRNLKRIVMKRTLTKNNIIFKLILTWKAAAMLLVASIMGACSVGGGDSQDADPVIVENAVAFIKRDIVFDEDDDDELQADDIREPGQFRPGGVLYLKDSASPTSSSRDITSTVFSDPSFLNDDGELLYDVRDLEVSYDGNKLLFSMRAPEDEDADEIDQPKWNVWEYNIEDGTLRMIMTANDAAEGQDISPTYLADGRIVFASTRQHRAVAILLDEGKPQYPAQVEQNDNDIRDAYNIHVMDDDGQNIRQLTFNQSHDINPVVLSDGRILFTRWDNAGANSSMNLYSVFADGSGLQYVYGRHSHDTGSEGDTVQFYKPIEGENGEIIVQLREFTSTLSGGIPTIVDINNFVEHDVATDGSVGGNAQSPILSGLSSGGEPTLKGLYGSIFPLYDGSNRAIVSWSACQVQRVDDDPDDDVAPQPEICTQDKLDSLNDPDDDTYEEAIPAYGLWVLDLSSDTQLPIELPETGKQFDEAVLMTSRPLPSSLPPNTVDADLALEGYGVINIRSIYDSDGADTSGVGIDVISDPSVTAASARPARFLRIVKPVSQPSDEVRDIDNSAFGRAGNQFMREIVGYVPVEPDGSVQVKVPADIAFSLSVLDQYGQRITARHENWLQLAPGETINCIGCHSRNSEVPHGRADAEPDSAYAGAPTTGLPFPNTDTATVSFADMGETMAEAYARLNGVRELSADIEFTDEWAEPASKEVDFSYAYVSADPDQGLSTDAPYPPIPGTCNATWGPRCRILINYETHIHPLWSVDRSVIDPDDGVTVIADYTCTNCHNTLDDMDNLKVPDGDRQIDLTDGDSDLDPDHFKSYRELLFQDNELEVVVDEESGAVSLRDAFDVVGTGVFETVTVVDPDTGEETEELVLDDDGNPIEITINVPRPINPTMSPGGARASSAFFNTFRGAGAPHAGYLRDAELKLLAEWLDLGGQYYNNPFDAPED